jgi:hypothetical protein
MIGLLLLAGLLLRGLAAAHSLGQAHPDEHQQYLEQAKPLAFGGPAARFSEQERNMRTLFYPGALACLLLLLDHLGAHDPVLQSALLRGALAGTILLLFAALAWRDVRNGRPVRGLALLVLAVFTTEVVYINVRLLSENAMMVPLLLGLLFLDRRPGLAGACFGLMQAVRIQSAFLTLGFLLVALFDDARSGQFRWSAFWRARAFRLGAGFLLAVTVAVGLVDYLSFGAWFHAPVAYFRACVLEGGSRAWGDQPWHYYLPWAAGGLLLASVCAPVWLLVGAWKDWRLAFVTTLFAVGHSSTYHKEFRFLWGALPLVLLLASGGIEGIWDWAGPGRLRRALMTGFAASLALGSTLTLLLPQSQPRLPPELQLPPEPQKALRWQTEPYRSSALALATVGRQPDATGVVVCDVDRCDCGNYFFLRRDIPLVFCWARSLPKEPALARGDANYLVLPREQVRLAACWRPEVIADCGTLVVCRLHSPRGRRE